MTADLEHFRRLYGRVGDAYGLMTASGPIAVREPLTDDRLRAHLEGRERIGVYFLDPGGRTDQLVFDVDEHNPELVKRLLLALDELWIEAYPEASKSKGYHVRAHFIPAPAADLRKIGAYVAHRVGVPDIEVFPKQDRRNGKDGLGNFMWLPLHGESLKDGKTAIVDGSNGLAPFPDQSEALHSIPINSLETLANALAIVVEVEPSPHPLKASPAIGDSIPELKRNVSLASLAGSMRRRGFDPRAIEAALLTENAAKCTPPLPEDEGRGIAASIARYEPTAPLTIEGLENFRPTDVWNARLFVYHHGDKVRYCERLGGWHYFDGKRWARETCGEVERLVKNTVRQMYELAALEPNDARRIEMAKHAARSEAAGKLAAILELAKTEECIAVPPEAFDAQPWLFNAENGTVDLITGELLPHRPEDRLTNLSPAEWRGIDAKGERFEQFLHEAMAGDREKIGFLQRAAGYTLSADMREQVFLFLHGPEAAGKGTFVRALSDIMGTYARSTEIGTFLTARRDTVRNDIASLVGSRLVTASEPEDGQVFDEGLIKILTGQDKTTARFLFREAFEFAATFKLWLQGNHRPHIRSTGGAMWRRLLIVPFTQTVPEDRRDKTLGERLKSPEERAGILAWMVRGCLDWQRVGLRPPDSVRAAVAEYRSAEDRLVPFLEECTGENKAGQIPAGELYAKYKAWAETNGERPMPKRSFRLRLEEKGYTPGKTTGGRRVWNGIFLVDREAV